MTRKEVYQVIDSEREYQEKIWKRLNTTIGSHL